MAKKNSQSDWAEHDQQGNDSGDIGRLMDFLAAPAASDVVVVPTRIGEYEHVEKIGHGGFGDVFKAVDPVSNELVAIKLLKKTSQDAVREAEKTVGLELEGIVKILHIGHDPGLGGFIVSEFVDGGSLRDHLNYCGALAPSEAADKVLQIARPLASLHRNKIFHRDLKPENVLMSSKGLLICDFGISVSVDDHHLSMGQIAGTLDYMSPQQLKGDTHIVDGRIDIWGLGVILYEMLTGTLPFHSQNIGVQKDKILRAAPTPPSEIRSDIPEELEAICLACLEKSVEDRIHLAKLIQGLEAYLNIKQHSEWDDRSNGWSINFDHFFENHLHLIGRQFAMSAVDHFFNDNSSGVILINGEPGRGKSCLVAELYRRLQNSTQLKSTCTFFAFNEELRDPKNFVLHTYAEISGRLSLHRARAIEQRSDQELVYTRFLELIEHASKKLSSKTSDFDRLMVFVDALDESSSPYNVNAFDRIPKDLPHGVFFVVTSRKTLQSTRFSRDAQGIFCLDLDSSEFADHNLDDGFEYVSLNLKTRPLTEYQQRQFARIADGNFLFLKTLCSYVKLTPNRELHAVDDLIRDLIKETTHEARLNRLFNRFWERRTHEFENRPVEMQCLIEFVATIASTVAPVTAAILQRVLSLTTALLEFSIRNIQEFLTVSENANGVKTFRLFHRSFQEFVCDKWPLEVDRARARLTDFCRDWSVQVDVEAKEYALFGAVRHCIDTGSDKSIRELLTDWRFLEAKTESGMIFDLIDDFRRGSRVWESETKNGIERLIESVLRSDSEFLADKKTSLFQCMWNRGWWYDSAESTSHYRKENDESCDGSLANLSRNGGARRSWKLVVSIGCVRCVRPHFD